MKCKSHPALRHEIVNSPNPDSGDVVTFPNGASAKLVLLGKRLPMESVGTPEWWPTAASDMVRIKFMRRIVHEGLALPILLATNIALLSQMYTTTSSRPSKSSGISTAGGRRVRLSYNRSPIADFGIVHGSARVMAQDRLAYYNVEDGTFMMGQDPNDHYWMYFTTLSGEEHFLDCGMFTFNFCSMANATAYAKLEYGIPETTFVPSFFFDRDHAKRMPLLGQNVWKPKKRVSILREPRLQDLVHNSANFDYCECHDLPTVFDIMKDISGRAPSDWQKEMVEVFLPMTNRIVARNMHNRGYLSFPKEPSITIDTDPGEIPRAEAHDEQQFEKYLRKWARRLHKGKISPDQWQRAFNSWRDQPFAAMFEAGGNPPKPRQ